MLAAARTFRNITPLLVFHLFSLPLCLAQPDSGFGDEGPSPTRRARIVRVPLPIQGLVDTQVRRSLDQVIGELESVESEERPLVVLEFWPPEDGQGDSSEFGRSLDLARFLASPRTRGVRTVAYVPQTIRGHAVLVALACEELVMHADAQIGAAGIMEATIDPTVRQGYIEIADRRRTIPVAVALGMLDPNLEVQRVSIPDGTRYVLSTEVAAIQAQTTVQSIDTVIPAGEVGLLSGDKLRLEYNFVSHLAKDRQQLARALNVADGTFEVDSSFGGAWRAIRIELMGPVTPVAVDRLTRSIEDQIRQDGVNFVCLALDSPGGSLQESVRLATYLAGLDASKVRTVAYVAREAHADASLIALACDQLAMHEEAVLGGVGAWELAPEEVSLVQRTIQEMMKSKSRSWSLPAALIDAEMAVHRYQLADSLLDAFFCDQELAAQPDPASWQLREEITAVGDAFQVDGARAVELRLARHVVRDFDEFRQQYQLEESPRLVEPNWAHELIAALATPQVAASLLFIGFFAMIAELSAPGVGIGGFLAAVCFVLFFWSNFLQGTAGWLEVLLFLMGLSFLAMEIFVLPGFGIFGLGGAGLLLASLILASQTFVIPRNDYQVARLLQSTLIVVGAMGGVVLSVVLLRKHFEESYLFRRLQLTPPSGAASVELERRESLVQYEHLVGQLGQTTTRLTPAGKADFSGELVDVVSDGVAVDRGQTIKVIEVAGNRVVVCEAGHG